MKTVELDEEGARSAPGNKQPVQMFQLANTIIEEEVSNNDSKQSSQIKKPELKIKDNSSSQSDVKSEKATPVSWQLQRLNSKAQ